MLILCLFMLIYEKSLKKTLIYVNMLIYVNITDRKTMDVQTHQKYISEPHKKK